MNKMDAIDLHTHSTHSDGTLTPRELVKEVRRKGLRAFALTDHDTTTGCEEASQAAESEGVELIAGIELSAMYEPGTLHLLGYFLDVRSEGLQKGLLEIQRAREERNPEIIQQLKSLGIEMTMEEVVAASGGGQVGRPHFARVLVEKGICRDFDEAFERYLGKGAPAYVDKRRLSPERAIHLIEEAGGVAVLAHPKLVGAKDGEAFEKFLDPLIEAGLKGIEAYSSCQSREEAREFSAIGLRHHLFVTGGSDFHGANKPEVTVGEMSDGTQVSYEVIEAMREYLNSRKKG